MEGKIIGTGKRIIPLLLRSPQLLLLRSPQLLIQQNHLPHHPTNAASSG